MGLTDAASVDAQEKGALSVAAHLGIMDLPSVRVEAPLWIDRSEVVRAPSTGVWHPVVDRMHTVAAGTLLGRITDPFGRVLHEVRAPFAGELLYVVATPPATEGEPLAFVGHLLEGGPPRSPAGDVR
jgi:predicted deacylase